MRAQRIRERTRGDKWRGLHDVLALCEARRGTIRLTVPALWGVPADRRRLTSCQRPNFEVTTSAQSAGVLVPPIRTTVVR